MGKQLKKICAVMLVACMCAGLAPVDALASPGLRFQAKTSGNGSPVLVKKVTYEGDFTDRGEGGKRKTVSEIEVDFRTKVFWSYDAKVSSVKDSKGKTYRGYLFDTDDDGCEIGIAGMKRGRSYTISLKGIRPYGSGRYRRLTLKIKVPAASLSSGIRVSRVSVDEEYGEIDVKFASKVSWKRNAKVASVKDEKGKSYKGYLTDQDDDECEIYIPKMKYNRTYKIKISGIRAAGSSSYRTITVTAKVPARQNGLSVKKIEYDEDYDDGRMEWKVGIEFSKDIRHKGSSYVIIRDAAGRAYSSKTSFTEWDNDECEVYLSRALSIGSEYSYEIKNVKPRGAGKYRTLKGTFTAYAD